MATLDGAYNTQEDHWLAVGATTAPKVSCKAIPRRNAPSPKQNGQPPKELAFSQKIEPPPPRRCRGKKFYPTCGIVSRHEVE